MFKRNLMLLAALAIVLQACAGSYNEGIKEADLMAVSGDYKGAYARFDSLCAEKPGADACAKRGDMKTRIGAAVFDNIKTSLEAARTGGLVPLPVIVSNRKDVATLAGFGYTAEETASAMLTLSAEETKTNDGVAVLITDASKSVDAKKRKDAVGLLKMALVLAPDRAEQLAGGVKKITEALALDAHNAVGNDDWQNAALLFAELKAAMPDYPDVDAQLADAQSKDNLAYYMTEGEAAVGKEDFDRALRLAQSALNYPESGSARLLLAKTRAAAAQAAFKKGMSYYDSSQPYKAYQAFMKGQAYLKDIPFKDRALVTMPTKTINDFLEGLSKTAEKEDDKGNYGLAYQLMRMVNDIDSHFTNAKKRLNALQDKIMQRAIKSIAVIPFKSPSYSPEAGKIFSSNITFFLYKNLTPDIKVVEREAMETLVKEYEVKTAGQIDDKSRENILSLLGADYLLMGDVLDYKVEANQSDTLKSVRVQTRTERVKNTEYDDWLKFKEKGAPDLPPAPPMYVEKPVIEEIKYKVAYYKKTGLVSMSYRVVDTKGRFLNTSVVELKEDVEDEATDGVDAGDFKVPMKRATIPSDIELLRRVQEKAIEKIGKELKELFLNPEKKYLEEAERLEQGGEVREAVERYSDVEMVYVKKGMDSKEVADRLGRLLDSITGI